jgi:hypothetical protein
LAIFSFQNLPEFCVMTKKVNTNGNFRLGFSNLEAKAPKAYFLGIFLNKTKFSEFENLVFNFSEYILVEKI